MNDTRHSDDIFQLLSPSVGVDNNWHLTNDMDTCVIACYGFGREIPSGEPLARRVLACLNAFHGTPTSAIDAVAAKVISKHHAENAIKDGILDAVERGLSTIRV